ncbi:MAG TPA: CHC2 zinc finger domain-containing protein [Candidatus Sumerlaeota bacterium]|nr:CHC2 zinc finger domain-containing protein [Candidatus Sumerlaeota bacterium]
MSKTQFFQKLNDIPIADIWERLGGAKPDRNGKVLCKFHIEDTPSAQIGGRRNTYHCYSCGITLGTWDLIKRVCNITENRDIFKWFEDKFGLTGDPPPAKVRKRAGAKKGEKDMTIDDAKTAMDFT